MILFRLAFRSLFSRVLTVGLTIFAIALSTALFLGVEKVRTGARASFADTISNTDIIMGARSGDVELLLYSVFRIGNASNNVTWESYKEISSRPEIAWSVPMSLGDSHRGFRVLGTTPEYFERYKYRSGQTLAFAQGKPFADLFDTVIGADVADRLGYRLGDQIVVAHGLASFTEHRDKPFTITGILGKTGTPVDRTVFVGLNAIEAIHVDWQGGAQTRNTTSAEDVRKMDLSPKAITAAMIGVKSRLQVFSLQRAINEYPKEPLLAVLPGVALQELWDIVGVAEKALIGVSAVVVITALLGMAAMIFSSLNERRREMAILRAVGAHPGTVVGLLALESLLITVVAVVLGIGILYATLWIGRPFIDRAFGLYLPITAPSTRELLVLASIVVLGMVVSLFPAARAYRLSLADGMTVRV
jgi:putative ABC transport system permease protein